MGLPRGETESRVRRPGAEADAAFVEAFLRANPAWLADHPELYRVLEPPTRVHGDGVTDHMAAMLRVQRERADGLLAAGRATAGLAGRVQDAVLALLRVPGEGPAALLALLARDRHMLDPAQGAGPLGFLGRAVAAALGR
jgi:uncharacterized protein YigA (DUF484 family)